jgi:uncharacterized protein
VRLILACALSLLIAAPALARPLACVNTTIERARGASPHATLKTLRLEIVATPEAREYGLMHRESLAECDGMAFLFPPTSTQPLTFTPQKFWMKNTLIPLDILFLDSGGTIIHIAHGTPLSLTPVGPDAPVATAIEIAGGRAKKEGITVGDKVRYALENPPWHYAH